MSRYSKRLLLQVFIIKNFEWYSVEIVHWLKLLVDHCLVPAVGLIFVIAAVLEVFFINEIHEFLASVGELKLSNVSLSLKPRLLDHMHLVLDHLLQFAFCFAAFLLMDLLLYEQVDLADLFNIRNYNVAVASNRNDHSRSLLRLLNVFNHKHSI